MATDSRKRQRQKQSRQARQAAAVAAARSQRSRRLRVVVSAFLALVLVGGVAILVGGGSNSPKKVSTAAPPPTTTAPTAASLPPPPDGATITGDTPCPAPDGSSPRTTHFAKPPPSCTSTAHTYAAEIKTSLGTIAVDLDVKAAPLTVNNFVVLARYHFFDGISFHRIIPGFVVQGGDPLETGLGGPGYKLDDELPKAPGAYKLGSLAMANSSQPNTNGSQFFIVSGDIGSQLPPQYSLFGQARPESMDVIKKIDAVGNPDQSGTPTAVVTMESVNIKES